MQVTHNDTSLRTRLERIAGFQRQGKFVILGYPDRELPGLPLASDLGVGRQAYNEFSFPWGTYTRDYESWTYTGPIPPGRDPQTPLVPVTLVLEAERAWLRLPDGEDAGLSLEPKHYDLADLNQVIAQEGFPYVAWRSEQDENRPQLARVENDSASVLATSLVWCNTDRQLVAAWLAGDNQVLKAIVGSLVTNSNKTIRLAIPGSGYEYVTSARKGYTHLRVSLEKVRATKRTALGLLHPHARDPQPAFQRFYVVANAGEDPAALFVERLSMAIRWPVLPAWAAWLLEAGAENHLVDPLEHFGDQFAGGWRVIANQNAWHDLIVQGIQTECIGL